MTSGPSLLAALALLLTTVLAIGCATPFSPELEQAEGSYDRAVAQGLDPASSVELYEARKQLDATAKALEDGEDLEVIAHQAYLAETRVKIAELRADTKQTRDRATQLTSERDRIRLEARSQQADSATQRAKAAEAAAAIASVEAAVMAARAEQERQRADDAEARAAQIGQELAELDAVQTERGLLLTLGAVLFEFDSAELKTGAYDRIERLAAYLQSAPDRGVLIEGFTDDVGADDYNLDLSRRRAAAVRDALLDRGVAPGRAIADGFGKRYPLVPNDSDTNRERNRRVEIVILKAGESAESARRQ